MRNLIKKILRESSDLDWIKDIPGEEGYGEKYRFFDIYVCFSEYDDEYGCYDGYSAFIKIPKYEVDDKWHTSNSSLVTFCLNSLATNSVSGYDAQTPWPIYAIKLILKGHY